MSKMYQHTMTLQLIIETVSSKCVMEMCVMEMCVQNVSTHNDIATNHRDSV